MDGLYQRMDQDGHADVRQKSDLVGGWLQHHPLCLLYDQFSHEKRGIHWYAKIRH